MKICNRCNIEKSLDLFNKDRNRKDGLNPYCKSCRKEVREPKRKIWHWQVKNIEMRIKR